MAVRRLPRVPDAALADRLATAIEALRRKGRDLCQAEGGLRCGADWVVRAEPA